MYHRTVIVWTEEPRPHRYQEAYTVLEGEYAQARFDDDDRPLGTHMRKIKAYVKEGFITAAVLLQADYDPCGRTDYNIDEEWSAGIPS